MSRVRVVLEGEKGAAISGGRGFYVDSPGWTTWIDSSAAHVVSVEDIPDPEPEHWPPKQGDLWQLSGTTYIVGSDGWGVLVVTSTSDLTETQPIAQWSEWALGWRATYPRLGFKLVWRAGRPVA